LPADEKGRRYKRRSKKLKYGETEERDKESAFLRRPTRSKQGERKIDVLTARKCSLLSKE